MWNAAARSKLITLTEQVLHVPGNYQGNILEMAMVFDGCLPPKWLAETAGGLIGILRGRSEIFRNVRLNTLYWKAEGEIQKEITPMSVLQLGRYFEDKEPVCIEKP